MIPAGLISRTNGEFKLHSESTSPYVVLKLIIIVITAICIIGLVS